MRSFLLAMFLFAALGRGPSFPASHPDDAANSWGGDHVRMEITSNGAHLEFDCATGTIDEPVPLSAPGRFTLKGTFTPEHGGPVRENEPSRTTAATYSGTVNGDSMDLRIEIAGKNPQTIDLHLVRGGGGRIVKCR